MLKPRRKKRKTYADCMDEILPKELYNRLLLYGLFSEKLPPFFDGKMWNRYCRRSERPAFSDCAYAAADYYSVRHNHQLRHISIPAPMPYERLVAFLRQHWPELQKYFRKYTENQRYPVSRVHVRKLQTHNSLFGLNYHNYYTDGFPEYELQIGAHYLVTSDISSFFGSLRASQIAAALRELGPQWPSQLCTLITNLDAGRSSSLPIGPHVCNLLSEIVLCRIDHQLSPRWNYLRSIDDFTAFVRTKTEADAFLASLDAELTERGLATNASKVSIQPLPHALTDAWPRQLRNYATALTHANTKNLSTPELQALADFSIRLMRENHQDIAIINYMLGIIAKRHLSPYAALRLGQILMSLAFSEPYLIPLLGPHLFELYPRTREDLFPRYASELYQNFSLGEPRSYLLYYATKYHHRIHTFCIEDVIRSHDCILLLAAFIYCQHFNDQRSLSLLKKCATELLSSGQMDKFWPFLYEILPADQLFGDWRSMKTAGVSFLKPDFNYMSQR